MTRANGLQSNRILAILFCNVDMGNIYFCSDAYISCSRMDIWSRISVGQPQVIILAYFLLIKIENVG